ncbi:Pleckstrin homology domain-containing protein [Aspergillus pseudoustus]|uniref:Pleckstrin homology domain-containing protein n=1 Tax=Aspergillus pseudoustus TaxID=1810923 RepID=A0ABR4KRA1_9EURO
MSETQKPVEETPVVAPAAAIETPAAPAAEAAATETPAAEAPAAEAPKEAAAETPAAATEETKADTPAEEAKEVTPASEGTLGYKAPGLVKSLRFAKRFFYFNDEAIEAKQLSVYRANEKPAVANPIVAWASQTGKGLLFFTKRAEDKATPAGIISLADISDITKEGSNEFQFKLSGHKHTFQASNTAERDSWIAALEAKSTEAKAEKETITSSESYKAELEKLTKPVLVEAPKKAEPKEEAKEEEAKKEEETPAAAAPAAAAPAEETKDKDAKSRSRSRKRTSIFGTLLGKKEEVEEKKEEAKAEETQPAAETPAAEAPAAETAPAVETPATETPVVAAAAPAEAEEKKEEEKKEEAEPVAPAKSKRTSIFGNFFQKVTSPSHEKTEKEAAAPTETTAVASTAPQLDNPVEEAAKPIEPESVTAAPEVEAAKEAAPESPAAESPAAATKDKRRTSFFAFGKKKGDSDTETAETEVKPKGNKLGGLFRKPSKAVKPETKEPETKADNAEAVAEATPAEESSKPADAPATEEAKPVVASTSTPVQAAA